MFNHFNLTIPKKRQTIPITLTPAFPRTPLLLCLLLLLQRSSPATGWPIASGNACNVSDQHPLTL
jgi:hypothetical protein